MYVIRPRGIRGTPAKMAGTLQCQTRFYPNTRHPRRYDYLRDFFMTVPHPEHVSNAPATYNDLYHFSSRNKYGQRSILSNFVPVPRFAATQAEAASLTGTQFVVRPLRHSGGLGYRTTGDRLDFIGGQEYISELFPKRREYRIIFLFGQPVVVLRKKPNEGVDETQPWGHENSTFQTINDVPSCKLSGTDVFTRLSAMPAVQAAHITAADILYNSKSDPKYAVLELNFCPGIDIENNVNTITEVIRGRGQ